MSNKQNRLVWIDLEMTGLDPFKDSIIEIATLITDDNLNIISTGPELIINQPEHKLAIMDEWNIKQHASSGLIESVKNSTIDIKTAENLTLDFIKSHCVNGTAPLCGNSVWVDRLFLKHHMPELEKFFHYRIIDVSSFKEIIKRWHPVNEKKRYIKPETHRALSDIKESINELKHYKKNFFINEN